MFAFFEKLIAATAEPAEEELPSGLVDFYLHFLRQVPWLITLLVLAGFIVAVLDAAMPVFIGRLISFVSNNSPTAAPARAWLELVALAAVVLIARPLAVLFQTLVSGQTLSPGLGNLIRWQSHWHVARQNWTFFQDEFAGTVGNRVVQTGPSLRESVLLAANAVWYICVYGGSALILMAASDTRLTYPVLGWFVGYSLLLRYFVPRIRTRSRNMSSVRAKLTGQIIDCYSNIATLKLYSHDNSLNDYIRLAIDQHTRSYHLHLRLTAILGFSIAVLNAIMIVATAAIALWLWNKGAIAVGVIAMTLPLTWQLSNVSSWVAQNTTALFENIGAVDDGIRSIAVSHKAKDKPNASILRVGRGAIEFKDVRFGYAPGQFVLNGATFSVAGGERVGLIGPSGAGKSTLVHVLLRLFELDGGCIRIDGQNISNVTLESLWGQLALVTQETSLLNRSIRDNITMGRLGVTEEKIRRVASQVRALEFIEALEDPLGGRGFDASAGDRGVKLSGGQKQRIAIARAMLKNAPILILDEATSALDLDSESEIQQELDQLMSGRTVIAIAHRSSSLSNMDRLIRLDHGLITDVQGL